MMPDRMRTAHRQTLVASLVVGTLLVGACTKNGSEPKATGTGGSGGGSATPVQTATGPPGTAEYRYANVGLVATMSLDGDSGTLSIQNGTGRDLPAPGFYLLDARDGKRVNGEVKDAASVPTGATKSFRVSIPKLNVDDIGLVILLMGHDNYGAFARR